MHILIKAGDILNGSRIINFGLGLNTDFGCINLADGKFAWDSGLYSWKKVGESGEKTRLKKILVAAGDYVNGQKIEKILKLSVNDEDDCAILENGERVFMKEISTWRNGTDDNKNMKGEQLFASAAN